MAPDTFKPLRLEGGRFEQAAADGVGLPLEAAGELARYERLLIQVARHLWLQANPGRRRVPKRFDEGLRLRLTAVAEGSVVPVLDRSAPDLNTRLFDPDGWVMKSQETIAETIATVVNDQPLPDRFPMSSVPTLVQFGSSLKEDERCVLQRRDGGFVRYDQQARRHLTRIISTEEITIDGDLIGRITGAEARRQEFWFTDRSGVVVPGRYLQRGLFPQINAVAERPEVAPFVRLHCRYTTDAESRPSAIDDVRDVETVVTADDPLGTRLRELLTFTAGWLDGEGAEPAINAIEAARDFAAEVVGFAGVDLKAFPTPDGGVLLEQQTALDRWALEIEPDGDVSVVVAAANQQTQVTEPDEMAEAIEILRRFLL